jgi:type I restriction enzyme R subunit
MFATASVDLLKKYYLALEKQKDENFKIATIFSYVANEEDKNDGSLDVDEEGNIENQHSREFLDYAINKYNKDFGTNFSTKNFEAYREDLQKRIKDKDNNLRVKGGRVDLVIVVNMMLTGFDAQKMNTLFVDKNLKYHGLIQAYSRTNRLFNSSKPKGNIVVFRNLKKAQDEALRLYGNPDANEIVFVPPYEEQVRKFNEKVAELREVVSEYVGVDDLKSEDKKAKFVKVFRDLMRQKVSLETFEEFS